MIKGLTMENGREGGRERERERERERRKREEDEGQGGREREKEREREDRRTRKRELNWAKLIHFPAEIFPRAPGGNRHLHLTSH